MGADGEKDVTNESRPGVPCTFGDMMQGGNSDTYNGAEWGETLRAGRSPGRRERGIGDGGGGGEKSVVM